MVEKAAPITVTFPKDEDDSTGKFLFIGSALAKAGGSGGSFEIKLPDGIQDYIIEPMKGSTSVGKPTQVQALSLSLLFSCNLSYYTPTPIGDLPSLVTECNRSLCPFSFPHSLFLSSYTPSLAS